MRELNRGWEKRKRRKSYIYIYQEVHIYVAKVLCLFEIVLLKLNLENGGAFEIW